MDSNQVWDVPTAISWMKALAFTKPYFIEEPTSPDDILGHAKIAEKLNPKTLVLSHILFWGSSESEILEEIMKDYDGKVILADDLIEIN